MYSHRYYLNSHGSVKEKIKLVRAIDPNLHYKQQMPLGASGSELVFLVEEGAGKRQYILKVELDHNHPLKPANPEVKPNWGVGQESRILYALRGVQGITHLRRHYKTAEYDAILKQYVPGIPSNKPLNHGLYFSLRRIIEDINAAGVVNLGLKRENIVVPSGNDTPVILALGSGTLVSELEGSLVDDESKEALDEKAQKEIAKKRGNIFEYKFSDLNSLEKILPIRSGRSLPGRFAKPL